MRSTILLVIAILFTTSACGGVRLTQQEISAVYTSNDFAYAAAGRDLRVVVVGNPFGGDRAEFDNAVTGYMQGNHWGQATNFTTTPGETARESYYVVMLFNPPKSFPGAKLCREKPADLPTEARDSGVMLFGAFCLSNKSLTEIKGYIETAGGPADPNFGDLVASVTQGLFPPKRRNNNSRGCKGSIACP